MRYFPLVLAAVLAPVAVQAMPSSAALDAGLAAYAGGQFVEARRYLRPLADRGSAIAETMMGVMAAKGEGRPVDAAAAAGWWLRAANRGYAPAQLAMAKALATGRGVAPDAGQAWVWAKLAASAGNGMKAEAEALAKGLARGLDAGVLAELEAERAAWRPWP